MNKCALLLLGVVSLLLAGQSTDGVLPGAARGGKSNARDGLKYALVSPGTFRMGCSDTDGECTPGERPTHTVSLRKSFWIGQTEVTVGAYKGFTEATQRVMPPEPEYSSRSPVTLRTNPGWKDARLPMVNASWEDAVAYCTWAGGRLPTEAEWECAARAGDKSARYGSPGDIAWYAENSGRAPLHTEAIRARKGSLRDILPLAAPNGNQPHHVEQKRPNAWGLFDMLGNVHEWVADWYGNYQASPETDPTGPPQGDNRVVRGGEFGSPPWLLWFSMRTSDIPTHAYAANGFRCALDQIE